jgi:hypothetical protein
MLASRLVALACVLAAAACSTYRDDLARGEAAFERNQHERALAILRATETDPRHVDLAPRERARYAYLRGMTDYRIGDRANARHWLLVARALDERASGALPADWESRLNDALVELDDAVYEHGIASLSNAPSAASDDAARSKKRSTRSEDEP